jgi:autophagy-related protein 9
MRSAAHRKSEQHPESRWLLNEDDADNDVPASLLVEGTSTGAGAGSSKGKAPASSPHQARRPGSAGQPNRRRIQAQWETAQAHQRLHPDDGYGPVPSRNHSGMPRRRPGLAASPKDKAMFRWANVLNLDVFIRDVYEYYLGAGLWCIMLDRLLHLLYVPPSRRCCE